MSEKEEKKFRKINRKVLARTAVKGLMNDLDSRDQKIKMFKRINIACLVLIIILLLYAVFLTGKAF